MIYKDIVETYKAYGMYLDYAYGLKEYQENPSIILLEKERHLQKHGFSTCIPIRKKILTWKDNKLIKSKIVWENDEL